MRRRNTSRSRNRGEQTDAAAAAPAIRQMSAESYATQNNLIGPISRELLVDPVRIQSENTPGAYERANITRWLQTRGTSPNTRQPASEDDLVPAEDIRDNIRRFVARYPNSDIVRDWLQQQPAWYTRIARAAAPAIAVMSRTASNIRNSPVAADCAACCSKTAETAAGAVVGTATGACIGCACGIALAAENEENGDRSFEEQGPLVAATTATGAAIGAVYGAAVGPRRCLERVGEACREWNEGRDDWDAWGGRKKKTRKNKKKKRRKTRRKKKKKKTRRKRKKNRKKRTRKK